MKKSILAAILMVVGISTLAGYGKGQVSGGENQQVKGLISVVSREDGSGTRGAFVELFGIEEKEENGNRTDHTTVEAVIGNSTEIIVANVTGDPNAIGYISMGTINNRTKPVKINGISPTPENVKNGSYKIARPFTIVMAEEEKEITKDFVQFILSSQGQKIVKEKGYIPAREHLKSYVGKGPKGKIVIAGSSSVSPVMELLVEGYEKVNPHAVIELQTNDSTTGIQSVIDGMADLGMVSRDLKESEAFLNSTVLALDGIAVIVNPKNQKDDFTMEQIRDIFTGKIELWQDLENSHK